MSRNVWVLTGCALIAAAGGSSMRAQPQRGAAPSQVLPITDLRRDYGQNVAPVYEGWEPNPDGTISMYFGYMNRNWKEELDIPVGPNNSFDPAPQDRGQPTHFLPRRRKQYFAITVPKDFPRDRALVWTLTIRGKTERVPGSLKPEQQIDVSKDTATGNKRPQIDVGPDVAGSVGQPVALAVGVVDDGLPKVRRRAEGGRAAPPNIFEGLNVQWSKYRGPGKVTFSSTAVAVQNGKAATTATFSEPGNYQILALADDGSILQTSQGQSVPGFACCWTTATIKVTIK
jgi:hypothetical protein